MPALTRKSGHAVRGRRTLCGQAAPTAKSGGKVTCSTCQLILSVSPHLA